MNYFLPKCLGQFRGKKDKAYHFDHFVLFATGDFMVKTFPNIVKNRIENILCGLQNRFTSMVSIVSDKIIYRFDFCKIGKSRILFLFLGPLC